MRSNNKMLCLVNLPNGTTFGIQCDPKADGQKCLEEVCKNLGFTCETEYFGLVECSKNASSFQLESDGNVSAHDNMRSAQHFNWLNLRNPLGQHRNTGHPYSLDFRVKFWVPPHLIIQEAVRNIFYMQAKSDLLSGRLRSGEWTDSAELSALLAHGDELKFDASVLKCGRTDGGAVEWSDATGSTMRPYDGDANSSAPPSTIQSIGCIPIDGIKSPRNSTLKIKKRRFSRTHKADCDNDDDDNDDGAASDGPAEASANDRCEAPISSPLHVYSEYVVRAREAAGRMPADQLMEIANQHAKLAKSTCKSAKYVLLQTVFRLAGLGEETFSGMRVVATPHTPILSSSITRNRLGEASDWSEHMRLRISSHSHDADSTQRCDIVVGPHGILINSADEQKRVPYNAASSATPNKRTFKLVYLTDSGEHDEVEIKLARPRMAIALYRSITEKHAFYSCETVGSDVTKQFIRDFKGTIASMFNVDTKLGRLYVFDIQRTYREVYDHARRVLHAKGMDVATTPQLTDQHMNAASDCNASDTDNAAGIKDRMEKEIAERISEAITCRICMDQVINTSFTPCGHIASCYSCAEKCVTCPLCRTTITCISRIYLPVELHSTA